MAVSDGDDVTVVKDMGLVSNVFDDRTLAPSTGHLAIGHTRYSTTGLVHVAQRPARVPRTRPRDQFALGHNGNLVNTEALADEAGMLPGTVTSDSDLVAELIARELPASTDETSDGRALERALVEVLPRLEGAFSFVLMDESRDHRRPRPQRLPAAVPRASSNHGWVLASETPALDIVGAHFVRELDPGEMVVIDATGLRSHAAVPRGTARIPSSACSSSSTSPGPTPASTARACTPPGCAWASSWPSRRPVEADLVMGVPESGLPAAEGYRPQRHPLRPGPGEEPLHRAHVHRPEPGDAGPRRAHEAQPAAREHRRQAPGRGRRLHRAGHHHPGHGQDAARGGGRRGAPAGVVAALPVAVLLRHGHRHPGRAAGRQPRRSTRSSEYLDVDTLAYLTLDRLVDATGAVGAGFCDACLTGDYPVAVPVELHKGVLEHGDEVSETRVAAPRLLDAEDARLRPPTSPARTRSPLGRELRGRRRGHRCRRGSGRRIKAKRALHVPARGRRLTSAASAACSPSTRPATPSRCWCRRPTAWAPRRWSPRPPGASTPSASTSWPCASTTSSARAPSRSSSSTTSPSAQLDPDHIEQLVEGVAEGCRQAGCALIGGEMAEHPGAMEPERVRPGRLRRRRGRAGPADHRRPGSARATCSSACPRPACARTATRWPAGSCCEVAGLSRLRRRWPTSCSCPRSSTPRPSSTCWPTSTCGASPTSPAAASPATSPGCCPTTSAPARSVHLGGAADLRRDPAARRGRPTTRWPRSSTWASAWSSWWRRPTPTARSPPWPRRGHAARAIGEVTKG